MPRIGKVVPKKKIIVLDFGSEFLQFLEKQKLQVPDLDKKLLDWTASRKRRRNRKKAANTRRPSG